MIFERVSISNAVDHFLSFLNVNVRACEFALVIAAQFQPEVLTHFNICVQMITINLKWQLFIDLHAFLIIDGIGHQLITFMQTPKEIQR